MLKLLLFDIDGTLIDVDRAESEAFSQAFEEVTGLRGINTDWSSYLNYTDTGVVEEVFRYRLDREPAEHETRELLKSFVHILEGKLQRYSELNREIAGARGFLEQLHGSGGYSMALATGCIEKSARLKLSFFDMNRFFPCGGFSDNAITRVDILSAALDAASAHYRRAFAPPEAIYIGDRGMDADAALSMGMGFVGVTRSGEDRGKMEALGVAHIFTDYTDRSALLRAFDQLFSEDRK
jgi:phosphoglycolate phosphatase-like HAD superfamily hydrolase